MELDDILKTLARTSGLSTVQDKGQLMLAITESLGDIDYVIDWDMAVKPFQKTISSGNDSVSVGTDIFFKPVYCLATVDGNDYPLVFKHLTDLRELTAIVEETSYPEYYSITGTRLYVGAGLMTADTVVKGEYRRVLSLTDIPYLPPSLLINRALMRLLKPGTPEHIAAWSGWKESVKQTKAGYKLTAEKRSQSPMDPQVVANMEYLEDLD